MKSQMFPTLTSDEQRRVKQQILVAFEQGCSVQDLLGTTSVPLHRATVYRLHQRFQTDPETALSDGRHGHPSKIRGDVRAWLEAYCQATPGCTSRTVQTALSERFALWVSIAHLNRVRATLGLSRHSQGGGGKSAQPLV
jgi:putative transposase